MSIAAAFLFAVAATAQTGPVEQQDQPNRGAQVETARVSVTILRPVVLQGGQLHGSQGADVPHSQRQSQGDRVIYAFE